MQKTMTLSEAKAKLNGVLDDVEQQATEFVITRNGLPVAAVVPMDIYEGWMETVAVLSNKELLEELQEAIRSLESGEPWRTFEEVFGESD